MPGKPFTNYLVALATDASEVERFRSGGEVARQSMAAAGLTDPDLQTILLNGDQPAIEAAVAKELANVPVSGDAQPLAVRMISTVHVSAVPPTQSG